MTPQQRAGRGDRPRRDRPRGPRPLSGAVEAYADRLAPKTLLAEVQRAWPGVAGEAIAAQAEPVSERQGQVTVVCASAVWAQELSLMATDLVARLNEALGGGELERVRSLRCVAHHPRQRDL